MRRRKIRLVLTLLVLALQSHAAFGLWTRKARLTRTPDEEAYPRIAVAGCTVHVVWIGLTNRDLHYTRSLDAGETWSAPRILAAADGTPVMQAEIAAFGRDVQIVWQQGAYDQARIFHRQSGTSGRSWRPTTQLSPASRSSEQPALAVGDNNVYVAWIQTRRGSDTKPVKLFLAHSPDEGRSWAQPRQVDSRSISLAAPRLAAAQGQLHLLWGRHIRLEDSWDLDIFHRSSSDGGLTWTPRVVVVDGGWRVSTVAADGETLHLLWEDASYKLSNMMYTRSLDGGTSWSQSHWLDQAAFGAIGADGPTLEAVWINNYQGGGFLTHRRSESGGARWGVIRDLGKRAYTPALAMTREGEACGRATHIVYARRWWKDDRTLQEIFYRRHPRRLK